MRGLVGVLLGAALLAGCDKKGAGPSPAPVPDAATQPAAPAGVVGEASRLLAAGQLDEALARLDAASGDPEQLALLGAVWSRKAELAPLPTPPPLPSPAPRKATPPPAPEFKPEELTAIGFLEQALHAQPGHPGASLTLARLLGGHAARRFDLEKAAATARKGRGKPPDAVPASDPDYGPQRILDAYRAAVAGSPTSQEPAEKMYEFAVRVERLDDAQWALEQLLQRDKEKPEPLVRYGDFLRDHKKEPHRAIERYREALIWKPDDEAVLARIADIYIQEGIEAFANRQWAVAEARLQEGRKYVKNPNSPQGLKLRDYETQLATIRRAR